jgi:signal transduction histidine kinase
MSGRPRWLHAARVAVVAGTVVVVTYALCVLALNGFVTHRLTAEADARLAGQLSNVGRLDLGSGAQTHGGGSSSDGGDLDDVPVFLWRVGPAGSARPVTAGAPKLPQMRPSTAPLTVMIGSTPFRLDAVKRGSSWVVAGLGVTEIDRVRSTLHLPELLFGLLLALATFVGALVVGLRASAPLDVIRRRQAEFTADASHELRTPLSVIEAEVDLALRQRRQPAEYAAVLQRIGGEGRRLRRIVEDLLWLARADDGPDEHPQSDRCDLGAVIASCTERFGPLAEQRGVTLDFRYEGESAGVVAAPPEWIERLAGVLVDNACKYAGTSGRVLVTVIATTSRVTLCVDDSGPGIAPEERAAVFDRFHRATSHAGGSGLGLAIADSVVRMTGGTWTVDEAPLGGARMAVWWRRATDRAKALAGGTDPSAPVKPGDGAGRPVGDPSTGSHVESPASAGS